jgi:hypothetical protein
MISSYKRFIKSLSYGFFFNYAEKPGGATEPTFSAPQVFFLFLAAPARASSAQGKALRADLAPSVWAPTAGARTQDVNRCCGSFGLRTAARASTGHTSVATAISGHDCPAHVAGRSVAHVNQVFHGVRSMIYPSIFDRGIALSR